MTAYQSWSVVFGEQPSAAKWNILGANDSAFNDGSGLPTANAAAAYVATAETTASTAYTDLTTTTDTVTATIGASGKALVGIFARLSDSIANAFCNVTFVGSGANTIAASDIYSIEFQNYAGGANMRGSAVHLLTSLSAGSSTFKMKYKVTTGGSGSGTGTFTDRRIFVIPL